MKSLATLLLLALLGSTAQAADRKMISADGSSTVFPITSGVAEEFQKKNQGIHVTVGIKGTGGGFKRFTVGEIDIANASRPITNDEIAAAEKNKISFIELPVAYDGIAVMVNPSNDFVTSLTVDELKRIWQKDSTVKMWSDVRPAWPKRKINLYGPGTDSGTFDYFTKAINGTEKSSRPDFTASEDDNTLVTGVSRDKDALGYFGFAYYEANKSKLKLVAVDGGKGAILPSETSIADASYTPLSRPIFIYVNKTSIARPEVDAFIKFYLENAGTIVKEVGYIALSPSLYTAIAQRYNARTLGTIFASHGSQTNVHLEALFATTLPTKEGKTMKAEKQKSTK